MISESLLQILVCPESHQSLKLASQELVDQFNTQIQAGSLKNRGEHPITQPIDQALIREDEKYLYPIRNDIPIMLIDEAIVNG